MKNRMPELHGTASVSESDVLSPLAAVRLLTRAVPWGAFCQGRRYRLGERLVFRPCRRPQRISFWRKRLPEYDGRWHGCQQCILHLCLAGGIGISGGTTPESCERSMAFPIFI
jgi:hypothetical protein